MARRRALPLAALWPFWRHSRPSRSPFIAWLPLQIIAFVGKVERQKGWAQSVSASRGGAQKDAHHADLVVRASAPMERGIDR